MFIDPWRNSVTSRDRWRAIRENPIAWRKPPSDDASGALNNLLQALEANKSASNDDWQNAIETMLSLANEG